jgi:divalent metal cation (Fe/Co/Zn/Cd) transporter
VDLRVSQPTDLTRAETSSATIVRCARKLEFFTLAWNLVEAAVAIGSGAVADSAALIAFGIDSLIESSSGVILLWRLHDGDRGEARERRALRLVGFSFLALAAYVAWDATQALIARTPPDVSLAGIVLAILSLIVMPLLAARKRRLAAVLRSAALHADSRQSNLCATLSGILLGGLSLNALWGWWWADPVAGLMMTPIIIKEGLQALKGQACNDCQP